MWGGRNWGYFERVLRNRWPKRRLRARGHAWGVSSSFGEDWPKKRANRPAGGEIRPSVSSPRPRGANRKSAKNPLKTGQKRNRPLEGFQRAVSFQRVVSSPRPDGCCAPGNETVSDLRDALGFAAGLFSAGLCHKGAAVQPRGPRESAPQCATPGTGSLRRVSTRRIRRPPLAGGAVRAM